VIPLRLDLSYLFEGAVGPEGLRDGDLDPAAARAAFEAFAKRPEAGEGGFAGLGARTDLAEASVDAARAIRAEASDLLHLGIGGSALGPRALFQALTHPGWNLLPRDRRGGPRIFFVENADPESLASLREVIDPGRTWLHVVSKSGGTVETIAQWLVARAWLEEAVGPEEARRRTVFTTDPQIGALRAIAREEGIRALDVPPGVGGRFSALTPVGLLPLAAAGIDPGPLLEGARAMTHACASPDPERNPALALASALHALDTRRGKRIHVLMAYADALAATGEWFRQLWAESLGKRRDRNGREVFTGPTPVAAVGAIDQHSQLQLYLEGPPDKVVMLLGVAAFRTEVTIPRDPAGRPELAYLGGHGIGELLDIERRATEEALARHGRPSAAITIEDFSPRALGALYQLLALATAYAGELYGIDAFDQPAVELGKQIAYRALGRPGAPPGPQDPPPPRDPRRIF
jgi:glucose-6-phosphate isomerase